MNAAPSRRPAPVTAPPLLSAARLAGLLAEPARLRVVAALVLGARTHQEVAAAAGLELRAVAAALARLVESELVVADAEGGHYLLEQAFAEAARAAAPVGVDEHAGEPAGAARVLRAFVRDGRLSAIPTARGKRLVVLDRLAQDFELGRRYSEKMVNLMLGRWHPDTAALRRHLVDEGFLSRERGEYWRTGGTVPIE